MLTREMLLSSYRNSSMLPADREMLLSSYRNSSMLPADKGNATVILSKQQYAARWQGKCYCHPIETAVCCPLTREMLLSSYRTAVCCPLTREMLLSSYRNSSMLLADKGNATVILSKQQYAARCQGKCYCHPIETAVCCPLTREMLLSSYRNSSMNTKSKNIWAYLHTRNLIRIHLIPLKGS